MFPGCLIANIRPRLGRGSNNNNYYFLYQCDTPIIATRIRKYLLHCRGLEQLCSATRALDSVWFVVAALTARFVHHSSLH